MKPLKRPVRRGILVAPVAVSVSRLGLTVGLLTLGITAFTTGDPATADAATRSMKIYVDLLPAPRHQRCCHRRSGGHRPRDRAVGGHGHLSLHHRDLGAQALGLTWRGRRLRISASSAKSVDARSPRQTA
ncbi:hypothetical protein [Streptomyces sp. NPDC088719]|uniref:hypothetical protein n=1 Tax=Streptomyces sp. NPDC088719 TaxID=3365872 RepID=UPI0037F55F2F